MPPSSTSLLPGPHDPYNASSVKLAEATRIRLVLPGLGTCDKDEGCSSVFKRLGTADLSGKPAESAAALAKARKKLLKIQGIASQADKAHSSVIVDVGVLQGEAAADGYQVGAEGRGQASSSNAAGRSSGAAAARAKRSSKHGAADATAGSLSSQQLKPRKAAASGDSFKLGSRLAVPGADAAAGDASADSAARAGSSSRGQPHVPIWERLPPPTALAEDKKAAATMHRVFQPVALKTFSPTLGSLGGSLGQDAAWSADDAAAASARVMGGGSRSRSAAKPHGQPPDVTAAAAATTKHGRHGEGARAADRPVAAAAAAADLGLHSRSFTHGYQSPSQLFEKLALGGPPS